MQFKFGSVLVTALLFVSSSMAQDDAPAAEAHADGDVAAQFLTGLKDSLHKSAQSFIGLLPAGAQKTFGPSLTELGDKVVEGAQSAVTEEITSSWSVIEAEKDKTNHDRQKRQMQFKLGREIASVLDTLLTEWVKDHASKLSGELKKATATLPSIQKKLREAITAATKTDDKHPAHARRDLIATVSTLFSDALKAMFHLTTTRTGVPQFSAVASIWDEMDKHAHHE